jgi:glycosyltransferase involved in cell wall biosynthesis
MEWKNENPKVSIIIPCYNHGVYLMDAINSVNEVQDKSLFELIIINDGSNDMYTIKVLNELSEDGYCVLTQQNQGLAAARNNGIKIAKGRYILPLDADNMIRPGYVYRGINTFENNPDISIVYGNARCFGKIEEERHPGSFNLQKLMLSNYIDACAMYRREVWEKTGGYDKDMPSSGVEDWELWMHASFLGYKFHYINEVLFDYRVSKNSMITELKASKNKGNLNIEYLIKKHSEYFGPQYIDENVLAKFANHPLGFIGKLTLKQYFQKVFYGFVSNGKLRKYV